MYYRLIKDENGDYEKDGTQYTLSECNAAYTPHGLNDGYTHFNSREDAIKAWGLRLVEDQERE